MGGGRGRYSDFYAYLEPFWREQPIYLYICSIQDFFALFGGLLDKKFDFCWRPRLTLPKVVLLSPHIGKSVEPFGSAHQMRQMDPPLPFEIGTFLHFFNFLGEKLIFFRGHYFGLNFKSPFGKIGRRIEFARNFSPDLPIFHLSALAKVSRLRNLKISPFTSNNFPAPTLAETNF